MNNHLISTLQAGKYFTMPSYLDEDYILTAPEVPISEALLQRLVRWKFEYIYSDGITSDRMGAVTSQEGPEAVPSAVLENQLKESTQFDQAKETFRDMVDYTEKVFTSFVTKSELSVKDISNRIRDLVETIRYERSHIIRITEFDYPGKNYLVVHSVKSTVLGIAIGLYLKLPNHRLIELGASLLLHEVGMIRLPPQMYMTNRKLTPEERKALTAHTLLGFKILKAADFPMSVCLAVLESHENLDGTGYPRNLTGEKISLYGKVISVCSSYAAMSSERPFRQASDGHNAILELLKNKGTRYDEVVLRALIQLTSLYPIGTFVELMNSAKGMVVQSNPENPKAPFVKLILSPEGETYAEFPLIDSSREGLTIKRALSISEAQVIKSTLI